MCADIEAHVEWLKRILNELDQEIEDFVKGSPAWKEKDALCSQSLG